MMLTTHRLRRAGQEGPVPAFERRRKGFQLDGLTMALKAGQPARRGPEPLGR